MENLLKHLGEGWIFFKENGFKWTNTQQGGYGGAQSQ
jgi:hypothetical protein